MKYYAVTEDPNELYHYGRLGMKWGKHIFGDKPKSAGYKKASAKLKKISASRNREQRKYNNAVKKTQKRINTIENLYKVDQEKQHYDQVNRDYKNTIKIYKAQKKQADKYSKGEAKMEKYVQQARQGKLKYGKLSPDQIQRVQERLTLEANTRRLGNAEKTWHQQKKEARRKGKLLGIEKGTAAIMEEVARAGALWGIQGVKNRFLLKSEAKAEGKQQKIKDRARNKRTGADIRRDVRDKLKQEVYENSVREGDSIFGRMDARFNTTYGRAKLLKEQNERKDQKKIEDNRKQLADDLYRKWLLGTKNDTPENIKNRINQQDEIRALIYGTNKKSETPDSNKPQISISGGSKYIDQQGSLFGVSSTNKESLKNATTDRLYGAIDRPLTAIDKARRRYRQKANKKNERKLRRGQYIHTDDDIWLD